MTRTTTYADRWEALIPDPHERAAWIGLFGPSDIVPAEKIRAHFTDLTLAHQWARCYVSADTAALLHANGHAPDIDGTRAAYVAAFDETNEYSTDRFTETILRTGLRLLHPHLARTDRDVIVAAGLTLHEVDEAIRTGTYNRDQIALLAGLT